MASRISRRTFLRRTGTGAIGAGVLIPQFLSVQTVDYDKAPAVDKKRLMAALGDTLIPTAEGSPGYRPLEQHGITEEVLQGLESIRQEECNLFNAASGEFFGGKQFVDLREEQRTEFLEMVVATFPPGTFGQGGERANGKLAAKLKEDAIQVLQKVFRFTRNRVFIVFYQNFPEHRVARDNNKIPLLGVGDQHQIINPNTKELVTGWDLANFPGPLTWEEEEARRAQWMKIHWHGPRGI